MGIEAARTRVDEALKTILRTERVPVDGYGNWMLQFGSALFFIRVLPMPGTDKHIVQVFSPMVSGVAHSPQLLDALNWINAQILFGRVAWVNGVVFAFSELVAETTDEFELGVACNTIATIADTYDNALQLQFGGQIAFPLVEQAAVTPTPEQTAEEVQGQGEEEQASLEELMRRDREMSRIMRNLLDNQASGWQRLRF